MAPLSFNRLIYTKNQRLDQQYPAWRAQLRLVCGDFFEQADTYDLILEQTFLCALDPVLRPEYARQMHRLLRPGSRLAGVLFDRDFEGGPTFGGHREEYAALSQPWFRIRVLAPCYNSIAPRAGSEVFILLEKEIAAHNG